LTKSWASPSLFAVSKFVNLATSRLPRNGIVAIIGVQPHLFPLCFSRRTSTPSQFSLPYCLRFNQVRFWLIS
jgi:hypothetical protein